jgi:DNA-binding NarL/FixJ family response regulator
VDALSSLIGRAAELQEITSARGEGLNGVVVHAPAGLGKSLLARAALELLRGAGAATTWIQATRSAASVPLGAFAGAIDADVRSDDPLELFRRSVEAVLEPAGRRPLAIGVDDAHLLDPTSAALVLHLANTSAAFVVATVRSDEPCPDAIGSLWKDAGARRLWLSPLDRQITDELAESVTGGPIEQAARDWVWDTSQGNALYVRELVRGALDSGALSRAGELWRMQAPAPISASLFELVSARLGDLAGAEREVLELLALGEPLRLDELTELVGLAAVGECESRGLIVIEGLPPQGEARLAHPLYGEAIRAGLRSLRAHAIRLSLAETVQRREEITPDVAMRVARWLIDADAPIPSLVARAAARAANRAGDPVLGGAVAERALDGGGGVEAALSLARSYTIRNQFDAAERVLAAAEPLIDTQDTAADFLEQQIAVLHWGLRRSEPLGELFGRAQAWWPDEDWQERLAPLRLRAGLLASLGAPSGHLAEVKGRMADQTLGPVERRQLEVVALAGLLHSGEGEEAYQLARRARPQVPLQDPTEEGVLALWVGISVETGYDWPDLEQWSSAALTEAVRLSDHAGAGLAALALAHLRVQQGRYRDGLRLVAEAQLHHEVRDPIGLLATSCAVQAGIHCFTGDAQAAATALARCRTVLGGQPPSPIQLPWVASAEAWVALAHADAPRAQQILLDAVAGLPGFPFYAARLSYEALRCGAPARTVAPALITLAERCESPLVTARAHHARDLAGSDGKALMQTVELFADIGAARYASEAAAQAAQIFAGEGRQDSARRAAARSRALFSEDQGGYRPIIVGFDSDAVALSRRETQLIKLAASGLSNAEIADQLVLSIRTVESHLYRAMQKLGLSDRRDLRQVAAGR